MLKTNILNIELLSILHRLGHTQKICVCDAGLPIPKDANLIDLALAQNEPSIVSVLNLINENMIIEEGLAATECQNFNENFYEFISKFNYPIKHITHEKFKKESKECIAFIRTGECTPYANIIITAGVSF